jgi:hypothetical protein
MFEDSEFQAGVFLCFSPLRFFLHLTTRWIHRPLECCEVACCDLNSSGISLLRMCWRISSGIFFGVMVTSPNLARTWPLVIVWSWIASSHTISKDFLQCLLAPYGVHSCTLRCISSLKRWWRL